MGVPVVHGRSRGSPLPGLSALARHRACCARALEHLRDRKEFGRTNLDAGLPGRLERASGIPLDLAVQGKGLCGGALDLLKSHSARLSGLRLAVVLFENDIRLIKMLLLDHAEHLEQLAIYGASIWSGSTDIDELDIRVLEIPRLKSLNIAGTLLPAVFPSCSSLRSLNILYQGILEPARLLDILRQCTLVEDLQLLLTSFAFSASNHPSPVRLPRLKQLQLTSMSVLTDL